MDDLMAAARAASRATMIKKREEWTEEFVSRNLEVYDKADESVLYFIADFLYHGVPDIELEDSAESIRSTFRAGYCYYFAHMLKQAFNRGEVCWAAPIGHIVWVDVDGTPYDIEGINESDCEFYIPERYLEGHVDDFKHVRGKVFNATREQLDEVITKYKQDNSIKED